MKNNVLRLAMILPDLNYGGIENVACCMSRMFAKNGYEVFFFLNTYDKEKSFSHIGKIKMVPYKMWEPETKAYVLNMVTVMDQAYLLKKIKQKYKIDISISFHPYNHILNILSGCKDKKILTVHEVTSKSAEHLGYFYYNKFFYKYLYKMADKIITVSKYCKWDLVHNMHMDAKNIKVIPNAIDKERLHQVQEDLFSFDTDNIVVTIGRLENDKQQWHILHAFQVVLKRYPDAVLIVVGEGNLKQYLISLARKLQIEKNVVFTGFKKNVANYLRIAKVLVLSSAAEAFPCVVQEALYVGVPIVVGDCEGGIQELISQRKVLKSNMWYYVDGGIISPKLTENKTLKTTKEEKQMGEAIIELIKNEEKRKEISNSCKRLATQYEEKNIEKKWMQLLRELMS